MRTFVIVALIFFLLAPMALAQTGGSPGTPPSGIGGSPGAPPEQGSNITLFNPLKGVDCSRGNGDCLSAFLLNILDFVIYLGSIVVIFMLVYVGFRFVVAQGSDTKISEARTMLLWTVIGALILLGAKAIALGVQATVSALGG